MSFEVSVWGLNPVTQPFDSLSVELQDALHIDPTCVPPDLVTLATRSSQLDAICCLRVAAVQQRTLLLNQEKLLAKTVNQKLKQSQPSAALAAPVSVALPQPPLPLPPLSFIPGAPPDDVSAPTCLLVSPAEQTMQPCQPSSADKPAGFRVSPAVNSQSTC